MEFKNEESKINWENFVRVNSGDAYSRCVVTYAERWANLMESKIADGEKLEAIAEYTSYTAETEDVTGSMYGIAVNVLSQVWVHGEQLRVWHNAQYGVVSGEGTVNPAVLTINY